VLLAVALSAVSCGANLAVLDARSATRPLVIGNPESEYSEYSPSEVMSEFVARHGVASMAVTSFDDLTGARVEGGASTAIAGSGLLLLELILNSYSDERRIRLFSRRLLTDLVNERRLAQQYNSTAASRSLNSLSEAAKALVNPDKLSKAYDLADIAPVDYLLTGAVIGYDKNLSDLGAGAGLVGLSSSYKKSDDAVTVLVQIIDVATGEIAGVGIGSESVTSVMLGGGVFKFLEIDRILELEGGGSLNEPRTYALYQALNQAVENMFSDAL